jgi:hypothetical protein
VNFLYTAEASIFDIQAFPPRINNRADDEDIVGPVLPYHRKTLYRFVDDLSSLSIEACAR